MKSGVGQDVKGYGRRILLDRVSSRGKSLEGVRE